MRACSVAVVLLGVVAGAACAQADAPPHAAIRTQLEAGRYAAADSLASSALRTLDRETHPDSVDLARVLNALVEARWRQGYGGRAGTDSLASRAVRVVEACARVRAGDRARARRNAAVVARARGDLDAARTHYEQALAGVAYADSAMWATCLTGFGDLLRAQGEYTEARVALEHARAIREGAAARDEPALALTLRNLALVLQDTGSYEEAKALLERALAIEQRALGPAHPQVVTDLDNLAVLHKTLGDVNGARRLYRRALTAARRAYAGDHPEVERLQANLGRLEYLAGAYARADSLLARAWRIAAVRGDTATSRAATTLLYRADVSAARGRPAAARALYERALAHFEQGAPNHPFAAQAAVRYAMLLLALGEPVPAESLAERARRIDSLRFGGQHPDVARDLAWRAAARWARGDTLAARGDALLAMGVRTAHLVRTMRGLAERQALGIAALDIGARDVALSTLTAATPPVELAVVYDAEIASRARVLDEMAQRQELARLAGDSLTARAARIVSEAHTRLAQLVYGGARASAIEEAETAGERAEESLARVSAVYRTARASRDALDALPGDATLVSYVLYARSRPGARRTIPSYAAFVWAADSGPRFVALGAADTIDAAIERWATEVERGAGMTPRTRARAEAAYRRAGEALRRLVWDPIEPMLAGARTALLVPDGEIHRVSMASLPDARGGYLVERGPVLHVLSTERDIVLPETPRRLDARVPLFALGGPDFGARAGGTLRFAPLPGTRREVERIARLWARTGDATVVTGARASEATVRREAPRHTVLHLATHGFFLRGADGARAPVRGSRGIGALTGAPSPSAGDAGAEIGAIENPLLLSGLALAGANARGGARSGANDGILTAQEIAGLDLSRAEWVVLSACNTARGAIHASDGVLGLRRALAIAGARTVILSEWALDDDATVEWMDALYAARFVRGEPAAQSVTSASRAVLAARAQRGASTHPFFWGGFVASGEWR